MTEKEIMIEQMYKKMQSYEYEKQCTSSKYMKADLDRAIKKVEKKIGKLIYGQ